MSAILSHCGQYRYRLTRRWDNGPTLCFIMLNPSTADAEKDDPTIRRCIRFAQESGYGGIDIGNLFGWRATTPSELTQIEAPVGPENDNILSKIISSTDCIVCAWGNKGVLLNRNAVVLAMIRSYGKTPSCLKMTSNGHPAHPLYLPAALRPTPISTKLAR